MTWLRFPCNWPFVRGIHRWPMDYLHKRPVTQCWCTPEEEIVHTVDLPVIWVGMTLMWRHCNERTFSAWGDRPANMKENGGLSTSRSDTVRLSAVTQRVFYVICFVWHCRHDWVNWLQVSRCLVGTRTVNVLTPIWLQGICIHHSWWHRPVNGYQQRSNEMIKQCWRLQVRDQ